jgi:hypothetical protein
MTFTNVRSGLTPLLCGLLVVGAVALAGPADAAGISYTVVLDGPTESPPVASPGSGTATIEVDPVAHTMAMNVTFGGLIGTTTASHIHAATAVAGAGTAGVATTTPSFAGFPLGVSAGVYVVVLDMTLASSYNPSYITAHGGSTATAEADLFQAIADGKAYLNIHSSSFPGGEIRGFLVPDKTTPAVAASWGRIKSLYH